MSGERMTRGTSQLYPTLERDRDLATELREASLASSLSRWTTALTRAVVKTFDALAMPSAGKGHPCSTLSVQRLEYLALDVTAFCEDTPGWQFPSAVCELENATDDARIAYSLWKVLCVRANLRVVFCYHPDLETVPSLVSWLAHTVVAALSLQDRVALRGETMVVVGSRSDATTFPYGFFQLWRLNANTGRFERFTRQ